MRAKRTMKWTFVLGPVLGLVVIGGLVYWTWCWGLWGRGNLLLQALFQCRCPAASEEARHKPLRVIASACSEPFLTSISPSGRYLAIFQNTPQPRLVRLDLGTGQMVATSHTKVSGSFLTDDLLIASLGRDKGYLLIDLVDGTQISLPSYESFDAIVEKLKRAERVFVTDDTFSNPYVVGLASDYKNNPKDNVALHWNASLQRLFDRLAENGISYDVAPPYTKGPSPYYHFYSLDGQRLYAHWDGVYLAQTNQMIVASNQPDSETVAGPAGWALENHAVIYGEGWYRYLIDNSQSPLFGSYFPVPQPILLLEVPQQYWASDE